MRKISLIIIKIRPYVSDAEGTVEVEESFSIRRRCKMITTNSYSGLDYRKSTGSKVRSNNSLIRKMIQSMMEM